MSDALLLLVPVLGLGFAIGLQHAFEADHLAAVSALVSRQSGVGAMGRRAAIWGLGHTLALLAVSGVVLLAGWTLPERFAPTLELLVGLLLVALGAQVLVRLRRERVHVHVHRHGDGEVHLHAHSHRAEAVPHEESPHRHEHRAQSLKTLAVGLAHGAAGSAALTVYVAASLESPVVGLVYVAVFGVGSICGMVLMSTVIALPLTAAARRLTWAHRALQTAIGCLSIAIGLRLAVVQAGALLG